MYKKTIFRQLLFTYLLIIIVVMGVIALALSWGYRDYVFKEKKQELQEAAVKTDELINNYYENRINYKELNESLDLLGYMTNARIYAVKLTKQALAKENLTLGQENLDSYLLEDLKVILEGREAFRKTQYSDSLHTNIVFLGIPLRTGTEIEGAILLFSPQDELNTNIARINLLIWLAALAAILLSGLIIYFSSLRISRPIKIIEETARKLGAGEAVADLNLNTGDELERMAESFNQMKNKLSAAENMRREFIASISHDLRTPLTSINGFVQGMLDGLVEPEDTAKYLGIIKQETKHLLNLTEDILELAKIQSGSISLCRSYFAVKPFLEEIVENTGLACNTKGIQFKVNCADDLEVYADKERLKQILGNIIGNSFKFTPQSGRITITAEASRFLVSFKVRDTGQGIAPEELPLIFERYYRGDKGQRLSTGGTGLGLNIAKTFVEMHGGRIYAQSEEGVGTEVSFDLPK
jgi:signal transduction histidine kinase